MSDAQRVMNGYIKANDAANFGEAVVADMELISGEDYKMVWTEAYNSTYPPEEQ